MPLKIKADQSRVKWWAIIAVALAFVVTRALSFVENSRKLETIEAFHKIYYDREAWKETRWLGVPIQKLPFDLFVYQQILFEGKPDVVIETGTLFGGSAYFIASMMDLIGTGQIISIDIVEHAGRPNHPRITYITGSSTFPEIVDKVKSLVPAGSKVMVVLDSDHSKEHVLNEMKAYHGLVTPGQYMIVEDSNINGHPVLPNFGPGRRERIG